MKNILEKYCQHENGLFLFPLPTGIGKTYYVLEYILKHYKENRRIFFLTNLKKNLPVEDLKSRFERAGKIKDFERDVCFLDSNAETIKETLLKPGLHLPSEITDLKEYKQLRKSITFLKEANAKTDKDSTVKEMVSRANEELRKELEPKFRRKISQIISDHFKKGSDHDLTETKKLRIIKSKFLWLTKLYPSVLSAEKKVFFLSMDKFFLKNTTIIRPSYYFWEDRITYNALVFIDEFDATKQHVLNQIIENGLNRKIDLVGLFTNIYSSLNATDIPAVVEKDSDERKVLMEKNDKIIPVRKIFENFKDKAEQLWNDYHISANLKTVNPETTKSFLFHDYEYMSVLKEGKNGIRLDYKPENRLNEIHFEKNTASSDNSIIPLLSQIKGFLTYFRKGILIIANNYKQIKETQLSKGEEFPIENAIHSMLDLFNLQGDFRYYLVDSILSNERTPSKKSKDANDDNELLIIPDTNFYHQGFRYYNFIDSEEHDLKSKVLMFSYENTPEKFMLGLAQKANVIAISATADCKSVVGNYDLEFLKSRLGENFRIMENEETERIIKNFDDGNEGYDKVIINVEFLNVFDPDKELDGLFNGNKEYSSHFFFRISKENNYGEHILKRYVRFFKAFKAFLINEDIKSFLALGPSLPAKNKDGFSLEIFQEFASCLSEFLNVDPENFYEGKSENAIRVMGSDDFDVQKEQVHEILKSGKKIFLISTYRTMGAGQNIQYTAPEGMDLVKVNNFSNERREKDFDAIYLDKPTHLIVNMNKNQTTEPEVVERIFQLEALAQKGDISYKQLKQEIRKGFVKLSGQFYRANNNYDRKENNLYSKDDFYQNANRLLNQAIGRISRCNLKNPKVYVYCDIDNKPFLTKEVSAGKLFTREYKALLDKVNNEVKPGPDLLENYKNKGEYNNRKAYNFIQQQLRWVFDEKRTKSWEELRKTVLRYPTLSGDENIPIALREFYIELPTGCKFLNYEQSLDYYNIGIHFTKDINAKVSPRNCHLDKFMTHDGLRGLFEKHKFATDFKPGKYIMSPVLYNNIYKGALGEIIGWHLIKKHCNIDLQTLSSDQFERFDFKTEDGTYVDFKLWDDQIEYSCREETIEKIYEKMEEVNARRVIIINIASERKYRKRFSGEARIIEIPMLFDLNTCQPCTESLIQLKDIFHETDMHQPTVN